MVKTTSPSWVEIHLSPPALSLPANLDRVYTKTTSEMITHTAMTSNGMAKIGIFPTKALFEEELLDVEPSLVDDGEDDGDDGIRVLGSEEGDEVGTPVGQLEGSLVGLQEGAELGFRVGSVVGIEVG